MKQKIIYLAFILFAITACNKNDENNKTSPGSFVFTSIINTSLKSVHVISDDSIISNFQLGDLKASKEFLFLLSNGGDNPIFDIRLTTNHPQFTIVPETISTLSGKSSVENDNFIPLISLGILHGTQLNGVGYTSLLPMGENSATLTITGKTVENGDTIELASEYGFTLNAKLMDISLFSNGQPIDLQNPPSTIMSGRNFGGLGNLRLYNVDLSTLVIQNIGNVEISMNQIDMNNGTFNTLDTISILPDQSATITLNTHFTTFSLSSNGTITNDSRIQLGNDGKGYFAIVNGSF